MLFTEKSYHLSLLYTFVYGEFNLETFHSLSLSSDSSSAPKFWPTQLYQDGFHERSSPYFP